MKQPSFERPKPKVVGTASPERKKEVQKLILGRFGEGHLQQLDEEKRKILDALEYEKKSHEKLAAEQANELTNQFLRGLGLTPFDVLEQNIHILPGNLYEEFDDPPHIAVTFQKEQSIIINAERAQDPLMRCSVILHEIVHLKNFLIIEASGEDWDTYRGGLQVSSTSKREKETGPYTAFRGLNEAVVAEIEKRYLPDLVEANPLLKEKYQLASALQPPLSKEELARWESIDPKEIIWVSKDRTEAVHFAYSEQRKVLHFIIDQIYKDNQDRFSNREEVLRLFFASHFTGRLTELAKLVNGTFGDGSFRTLGFLDRDANSAHLVMNHLKLNYRRKRSKRAGN